LESVRNPSGVRKSLYNLIWGIQLFFKSRRNLWIRLLASLVAVAGAVMVGLYAHLISPTYLLPLAGLPLFALILIWGIENYWIAPALIFLVAAFVPFSLPTGTASRIVISLVVTVFYLFIWIFKMFVIDRKIRFFPTPINTPLISFAITVVISLIWSIAFRDAGLYVWNTFLFVQIAAAMVMILLPAALLMTANVTKNVKSMQAIVIVTIIVGILELVKNFFHINLPVNANGLFGMWFVAVSTSLALFNEQLAKPWRIVLLVLVALRLYTGIGMGHITWLTGWLPLLLAVGVISFMRSKILAVLILIVGVVIVALNFETIMNIVIPNEMQESGVTRLAAWAQNWDITSKHWLFGTGPAGYALYYMTYFPTTAMATHSNYIDILSQTGFVGLIFLAWLFVAIAIFSFKLSRRLNKRRDFQESLANAILAGTLGCIVMMALGDWILPFAYTQTIAGFNHAVYSWIFMGMAFALDRITPGQLKAR
jgi:hypothetical protein